MAYEWNKLATKKELDQLETDIAEGNVIIAQATIAHYASEDMSKGTIEERLTKLGFKEGTISWNSRIVSSHEPFGNIRRQGNYCLLNILFYDFELELTQDERTNGSVIIGTIPPEFVPSSHFEFYLFCDGGSYNWGGGNDSSIERGSTFRVRILDDGSINLLLDDSGLEDYINNITISALRTSTMYSNSGMCGMGYEAKPL